MRNCHSDGHSFERFYFSSLKKPPSVNKYDALWVMGGPMNVWEGNRYPWLVKESYLLRIGFEFGKPFLGFVETSITW